MFRPSTLRNPKCKCFLLLSSIFVIYLIFVAGYIVGKRCKWPGLTLCSTTLIKEVSNYDAYDQMKTKNPLTTFENIDAKEKARGLTLSLSDNKSEKRPLENKQKKIQRKGRFPMQEIQRESPQIDSALRKTDQKGDTQQSIGTQHGTVPSYTQIRESDSPKIGDFLCGGSAVENCCAFYVHDINEAKMICNVYLDLCKGFVMSSVGSGVINSHQPKYLMYLKNNVASMVSNFLTDFYIKTVHMRELGWRGKVSSENVIGRPSP